MKSGRRNMFGVCYTLCQVKEFGDFDLMLGKATENFKKINDRNISEFCKAKWQQFLSINGM